MDANHYEVRVTKEGVLPISQYFEDFLQAWRTTTGYASVHWTLPTTITLFAVDGFYCQRLVRFDLSARAREGREGQEKEAHIDAE